MLSGNSAAVPSASQGGPLPHRLRSRGAAAVIAAGWPRPTGGAAERRVGQAETTR